MKRIVIWLLIPIFMSLIFSGCFSNPGQEYLGKWNAGEKSGITIDVKRNGENYLVSMTWPGFGMNKPTDFPAVIKDGSLTIQFGGGPMSFTYVKNEDILLGGVVAGTKFHRLK